jgi:GxxExxY protein
MELNHISGQIVDAALKVHRATGPGLLEGVYETCLSHELRGRGLVVVTQLAMPVVYDGIRIDAGYRLDLLVNDSVIVELKACSKVLPIHEAQLLSYLRLSGHKLGLLINFHEVRLRDGITRLVNRL